MDVAGDRVGGHDQGGVERVDVVARDRSLRMADQGGDGDLRETEIVRDAGEAVAENVRGDVGQGRVREDLLPVSIGVEIFHAETQTYTR